MVTLVLRKQFLNLKLQESYGMVLNLTLANWNYLDAKHMHEYQLKKDKS